MKKILAAALAASVFASFAASPAFADCAAEIEKVQAAFDTADLDEEDQGTVAEALETAAANAGSDEAACMAAIEEAKIVLSIE